MTQHPFSPDAWQETRRKELARGATEETCVLVYQPADLDPETSPIMEQSFANEGEARAWADARFVVPLRLDQVETVLSRYGEVLFTGRRHFAF